MTPVKKFIAEAGRLPSSDRMPVVFVGHGNPMNLIEDNAYSRAWTALGESLPRPSAILCVSAHWFVHGTFVHAAARPRTIHDFYGFPPELYARAYPCPGSPELAEEVRKTVKGADVRPDLEWGVDHGAWMPLGRMYPKADIPTFQLSIDHSKPAAFHYALAKELAPLRRKGVLIVGSGNIVHNLGMIEYAQDAAPYDWAAAFDARVGSLIMDGDHDALMDYEKLGDEAALAVPTPDHYFPLLTALALQEKGEQPSFFVEGIAHGSVSMRSFTIS
ncbi:MAG TPA: 4,5-DOPA dioxygenase extradiol [Candidatus Eisenbacteria bacterium]|nr:4,5-DOPA dioxygenase extradiol [Candidatus Eisenbacteria bacterium]